MYENIHMSLLLSTLKFSVESFKIFMIHTPSMNKFWVSVYDFTWPNLP